jgi:hypothetical protein
MGSPEDFLLAAQQLPAGVEAFDRSAVSRMYYCVFHEARTFIALRLGNPDELIREEGEGSHDQVCRLLGEIEPDAGDLLRRLKERRVRADYRLERLWPPNERVETLMEVSMLRRSVFGTA